MNSLPLPTVEEISIDELLSALPARYRIDRRLLRTIARYLPDADRDRAPVEERTGDGLTFALSHLQSLVASG